MLFLIIHSKVYGLSLDSWRAISVLFNSSKISLFTAIWKGGKINRGNIRAFTGYGYFTHLIRKELRKYSFHKLTTVTYSFEWEHTSDISEPRFYLFPIHISTNFHENSSSSNWCDVMFNVSFPTTFLKKNDIIIFPP